MFNILLPGKLFGVSVRAQVEKRGGSDMVSLDLRVGGLMTLTSFS